MRIDVHETPATLPRELRGSVCVVFDVLRATTTIVTALAHGAAWVEVVAGLDAARRRVASFADDSRPLLCGERFCLPPEGFDLGNSPGQYTRDRVAGRGIVLSTTNGTVALTRCAGADAVYAAALVNARATARATARAIARDHRDAARLHLVCAGTDGLPSDEDLAGAGALVDRMRAYGIAPRDAAGLERAEAAFVQFLAEPARFLERSPGGRNLLAAGLPQDLAAAAAIDTFDLSARARAFASGDACTLEACP